MATPPTPPQSTARAQHNEAELLSEQEPAQERLRNYQPPLCTSAEDLIYEHEYYLSPVLPPAFFMLRDRGGVPVPYHSPGRLLGVRSRLRAAGRILGGDDEVTEQRWEALADPEFLRTLSATIYNETILQLEMGQEWEFALFQFCEPGGNKSWLAPGTRRWAALRALAQLHARRPGESEEDCHWRCWCGDAWGTPSTAIYIDPISMPHLLLDYMVTFFVRLSPEQYAAVTHAAAPHLRIDFHELDPDGARRADLPDLHATGWGDGFCTVHPCGHWLRVTELTGKVCHLCGGDVFYAIVGRADGRTRQVLVDEEGLGPELRLDTPPRPPPLSLLRHRSYERHAPMDAMAARLREELELLLRERAEAGPVEQPPQEVGRPVIRGAGAPRRPRDRELLEAGDRGGLLPAAASDYLARVRTRLEGRPVMYERLLDLVCEWRAGRLDLDGVLTRVTQLFADDPALALGFNIFLP